MGWETPQLLLPLQVIQAPTYYMVHWAHLSPQPTNILIGLTIF